MGLSTDVIRVLLVHAYPIVREGLGDLLTKREGVEVVGTAGDTATALRLIDELDPHIVLLDIGLLDGGTIDEAAEMQSRGRKPRVVIFSATERDRDIDAVFRTHLWGYADRTASVDSVLEGVRNVARGRRFFCRTVASRIISRLSRDKKRIEKVSRLATLSTRELQITRHLSLGMSVKDLARLLRLSAKTVDNQKAKIMNKLDLHDRVDLCRFAVREGIITA